MSLRHWPFLFAEDSKSFLSLSLLSESTNRNEPNSGVVRSNTLSLFSLFDIPFMYHYVYTSITFSFSPVDRDIFRFSLLSYFHEFVREKNIKKHSYFLLISCPNRVLSYRVSNQYFFLIRSIFVIIYTHIYIYLYVISGYKRINGVKTRFEPWSGHIGKCMEAT